MDKASGRSSGYAIRTYLESLLVGKVSVGTLDAAKLVFHEKIVCRGTAFTYRTLQNC